MGSDVEDLVNIAVLVQHLLAENERALEFVRLPRRKPRVLEQFNDLIHELCLSWRKRRRLRVPVQTSANVRVDRAAGVFECLDLLVEFTRSAEHFLKGDLGDDHSQHRVPAANEKKTAGFARRAGGPPAATTT